MLSAATAVEPTGTDLPDWIQWAVLSVWRQGFDTLELAQHFDMAEADVCRITAADQDRRHAARSAPSRTA